MRAVALIYEMIVFPLILLIHNFLCRIQHLVYNFFKDEGGGVHM